jgi:hypothetical protein
VTVRQITTAAGLTADAKVGCIQASNGGRAWRAPEIPGKMLVLDRRVAVVALDGHVLAEGALVVRDPVVVGTFVAAHQALQRMAEAILPTRQEGGPPDYLIPVLAILLRGATDADAAAKLGLSPGRIAAGWPSYWPNWA